MPDCEGCRKPAEVAIGYMRTTSRGAERVRRMFCTDHAREVWQHLPQPLRETAIIEELSHV